MGDSLKLSIVNFQLSIDKDIAGRTEQRSK